MIDLFKKPEVVIGGYLDGVRKRYVNPISFFGLAITVTGLYILILNKFYPEAIDFSNFTVEGQEEFQKKNMSFVQEYMSILMMLYIPIYALIARITFVGLKKFNYTELLVVFLYWQSQISIITAFVIIVGAMFGISQGNLSMVFLPIMMLYAAYIFRRMYQLSFGEIVLRSFLFLIVLGVVFLVVTIIVVAVMFMTGDMQQMIELQKAAIEAAN